MTRERVPSGGRSIRRQDKASYGKRGAADAFHVDEQGRVTVGAGLGGSGATLRRPLPPEATGQFEVRQSDATSPALYVDADGDLGVKTNDPKAGVHLKEDADVDGNFYVETSGNAVSAGYWTFSNPTGSGVVGQVVFNHGNPDSFNFVGLIQAKRGSADDHADLHIRVQGPSGFVTGLWLDESGDFGVNTTAPTEALDVSGNIKASGTIEAAGGKFLGVVSSDPGSPSDGEFWYNSTANKFRGRAGGATVDFH